jgi:hypothetical protein
MKAKGIQPDGFFGSYTDKQIAKHLPAYLEAERSGQ